MNVEREKYTKIFPEFMYRLQAGDMTYKEVRPLLEKIKMPVTGEKIASQAIKKIHYNMMQNVSFESFQRCMSRLKYTEKLYSIYAINDYKIDEINIVFPSLGITFNSEDGSIDTIFYGIFKNIYPFIKKMSLFYIRSKGHASCNNKILGNDNGFDLYSEKNKIASYNIECINVGTYKLKFKQIKKSSYITEVQQSILLLCKFCNLFDRADIDIDGNITIYLSYSFANLLPSESFVLREKQNKLIQDRILLVSFIEKIEKTLASKKEQLNSLNDEIDEINKKLGVSEP